MYDSLNFLWLFGIFLFGSLVTLPEIIRDKTFELSDYWPGYGPDYRTTYYGLQTGLRTGITGLLTDLLTETNLTPGPPRQESISFIKRSNKKTVCFWGGGQNHKSSPGEESRHVDPNQTTYIGLLEISNEFFPSGYPSGNLPGPSGTHVKQQLPVSFR